MADYIPSSERAKIVWLYHFAIWMGSYGLSHGFTLGEACALVSTVLQARLAASNTVDKEADMRASVRVKKDAIAKAVVTARGMARRLQADPTMTDGERAAAGITVPDSTRTAASPDAVRSMDPPLLHLDFSKRLQVIIHCGTNPHDERRNGRPLGVIGCEIQFHRGGIPDHEADWVSLDIATDSPYIHIIHENAPTTYAYRARYVSQNLTYGNFGNPAECTVSV